jgi:hypothetical protein
MRLVGGLSGTVVARRPAGRWQSIVCASAFGNPNTPRTTRAHAPDPGGRTSTPAGRRLSPISNRYAEVSP